VAPPAGGTHGRRTGLVVVAAVLGVLVLLLCIGGGVYALSKRGNQPTGNGATSPAGGPNTSGPSPATSAAPSGEAIAIPCDRLKGQPFGAVEGSLSRNGYKVKRVDQPGGRSGEVVDIQPCSAPRGSEITVTVSTGRASGGPGLPGATCLPVIGCPSSGRP
jgi:hypothetical protein